MASTSAAVWGPIVWAQPMMRDTVWPELRKLVVAG